MQQTTNYNLNKPDQTDVVNIEDFNSNFDTIDMEIKKVNDNKISIEAGKMLTTNDYTTAEKNKLSGITANANNYTHPTNHPPTIIQQDSNNRFVTDSEKVAWNNKAGTVVATTSANGLLSASDKAKLDGISAGANDYTHPATHPAAILAAGTLVAGVVATNGTDYTTSRLRNLHASPTDITAGVSALASGTVYLVYE